MRTRKLTSSALPVIVRAFGALTFAVAIGVVAIGISIADKSNASLGIAGAIATAVPSRSAPPHTARLETFGAGDSQQQKNADTEMSGSPQSAPGLTPVAALRRGR